MRGGVGDPVLSRELLGSLEAEILAPLKREAGYGPAWVTQTLQGVVIPMVISAEMKLRASIMRRESRCSHHRLDYPKVDDVNWRVWTNIHKDAVGKMRLERQPIGVWPDGRPIGA